MHVTMPPWAGCGRLATLKMSGQVTEKAERSAPEKEVENNESTYLFVFVSICVTIAKYKESFR